MAYRRKNRSRPKPKTTRRAKTTTARRAPAKKFARSTRSTSKARKVVERVRTLVVDPMLQPLRPEIYRDEEGRLVMKTPPIKRRLF